MKLQGSHKFVASVVVLFLLVWGGWRAYSAIRLGGVVLDTIEPGRINIVAVSPEAGYKIIVANQIAYLGKVEGDFGEGEGEPSDEDVANRSRLPLRELLQTLQGDEEALGVLVMRLNDWPDTDTASGTPVWKSEDIAKAIAGDEELRKKLANDLNVDLDGVPVGQINMRAIEGGILVDCPVTMEVKVGDEVRTMTARVQEQYVPRFCTQVFERIRERPLGRDGTAYVQGVYTEMATPLIEAGKGEDVRRSLETRYAPKRLQGLVERPQQVLKNTVVLLNESHVKAASFESYDVGQGQEACDVSIGLSEEGRMRLWKYSHDNRGFQLLFTVDSVAIAAPKITTDLAESTVTIRRVPSKDLVADAIELINEILSEKT